jgi:hypothetical protein
MPERKRVPPSEAILDAAVEYTFPASDPISIDYAYAAREREQNEQERTRRKVDEG